MLRIQPDLVVRIAVTTTDAGPLLIWMRLARDGGFNQDEENTRFADLLANIRFADRAPGSGTQAAATAYDGVYQWTLTAEDAKTFDPNYSPDSDASYPWTLTLNLGDDACRQSTMSANRPRTTVGSTPPMATDYRFQLARRRYAILHRKERLRRHTARHGRETNGGRRRVRDDDEAVDQDLVTDAVIRSPTAMSPRPRMFLRVPPRPPTDV